MYEAVSILLDDLTRFVWWAANVQVDQRLLRRKTTREEFLPWILFLLPLTRRDIVPSIDLTDHYSQSTCTMVTVHHLRR